MSAATRVPAEIRRWHQCANCGSAGEFCVRVSDGRYHINRQRPGCSLCTLDKRLALSGFTDGDRAAAKDSVVTPTPQEPGYG